MNDDSSESSQSLFQTADGEFVKLQIAQAMETYRTCFALLVTLITVLTVANVSLVGYAVQNRSAGVILMGAMIPVLILYALYGINRIIVPIIYTAYHLEQRYGGRDTNWLATTFLGTSVSEHALIHFREIEEEPDLDRRMAMLQRIRTPMIGRGKGLARTMIVLAIVGQIVAPLILTSAFGWELF